MSTPEQREAAPSPSSWSSSSSSSAAASPLPSSAAVVDLLRQLKRKDSETGEDESARLKMSKSSDGDDPTVCGSSKSTSCSFPSSSSPSSSVPFPLRRHLQFFVRSMFPERTVVIRADPYDTVNSVIHRVAAATGISVAAAQGLRLIYGSRNLRGESTLLDSAIEKDATLHLTGRLLSTKHPRAWSMADGLVNAISSLESVCQTGTFLKSTSIARARGNIERLVKQFLVITLRESAGNVEEIAAYIEVFVISEAPRALVNLYSSSILENRMAAKKAICMFLTSNPEFYPEYVYTRCAPSILFHFCKLLRGAVGKEDQLYCKCRSVLAAIMKASRLDSYAFHMGTMLVELHCFIKELVEVVELSSSQMYAPPNLSAVLDDLFNFLATARKAIRQWSGEDGPSSGQLYDSRDPKYDNHIGGFFSVFRKLLLRVDQCLGYVVKYHSGQHQQQQQHDHEQPSKWTHLLLAVTVANVLSKFFADGEHLLHLMLYKRRDMLNILFRDAKRNPKFLWFLKYKDVTNFQSRRNLISMMFPEGNEEDELYEMLIDRSQLLTESFEYIGNVDAASLRGELFMEFKNEEATGPGVIREWFFLLCQAIFNPQNALFMHCPNDYRRFFPNPASIVNPLHLKYFHFTGRVIALALMHKVQVGITLERGFFLQLAGKSVSLEDVRDADPMFYKSCKQIMDLDAALLDSDDLGLTFSREIEEMGSKKTVELQPGGKDIAVNSRNREEYIRLLFNDCFVTSISEQVSHFAQGFGDILSKSKYKQIFFQSLDLEDVDRMLSGSNSDINVNEWRAHTEYNGYKATHCQVRWFWEIVEGMSEEQRRGLLFFWTSVKYLPVDGFGGLPSKLYLYKSSDSQACLPTSHTCFYQLCLPAYKVRATMHHHLQLITQKHIAYSFGNC